MTRAVASAASNGSAIDPASIAGARPKITLAYEHGEAMKAMAHAQDARDAIVAQLLDHAQTRWPDQWHELAPLPFRFASWVGYDMDGRTDITWSASIGFRLAEKAERLARYVVSLEAIDPAHPLLGELRPAATYAQDRAQDFAARRMDQGVKRALTGHKVIELKL